MNWLKRMIEYWQDKRLAERCGLKIEDVCHHQYEKIKLFADIDIQRCTKCNYRKPRL